MPSATIIAIAAAGIFFKIVSNPYYVRKTSVAGEGQEPGLLLGGQRIGHERYKCKQTAGYRSTGGEPCGSAGGKIGSGYEFKLNKVRNAYFHDRANIPRYDSTSWTLVKDYSTDSQCNYVFPSKGDYILVARAVNNPQKGPENLPIIGVVVTVE